MREFISKNGFIIKLGQDAMENDYLISISKPKDIWLHLDKNSSAHAVISYKPDSVFTKEDIREAAVLLKSYSKFKGGRNVSVCYTEVHNVIKNKRDPPGMVRLKSRARVIKVT